MIGSILLFRHCNPYFAKVISNAVKLVFHITLIVHVQGFPPPFCMLLCPSFSRNNCHYCCCCHSPKFSPVQSSRGLLLFVYLFLSPCLSLLRFCCLGTKLHKNVSIELQFERSVSTNKVEIKCCDTSTHCLSLAFPFQCFLHLKLLNILAIQDVEVFVIEFCSFLSINTSQINFAVFEQLE